jgi:IPT/TIG domain
MAVVAAGITPAGAANPPPVGPVYPAPGSGTLSSTGAVGQTGGLTYSFSGVNTTESQSMVWGLDPTFPATWSFGLDTTNFAFDGTDSNLAGGEAVYTGAAEFPNLNGSTPTLPMRLVVQAGGGVAMETSAAAGLGINPIVGAVVPVAGDFAVNLIFEVSPNGGTTWDPADTYYDATPHPNGSTTSNVSGAFWYEPVLAPTITSFTPKTGPVGTVVTIKGTHLLNASVTFNAAVTGTITKNTNGTIKVHVPVGAIKGKITVTTPGGVVKTATAFKVT